MARYDKDLDEDEFDEYYGRGERLGTVASGAATGASAGAAIGTLVPGVGNVVGGVAGGVIGGAVGLYQGSKDKEAAYEAMMRDQELQERLGSVDHLEAFSESIALQTAEGAQRGAAKSRQAAARGGLSGAQQAGLLASSARTGAVARTRALAGAVAPAAAADRSEKKRILQEEGARQALLDDASQGSDAIANFGKAAGIATTAAGIASGSAGRGTGGYAGKGKGAGVVGEAGGAAKTAGGSASGTPGDLSESTPAPDFGTLDDPVSGLERLKQNIGRDKSSPISAHERNGDPGVKTYSKADELTEEYSSESEKFQAEARKTYEGVQQRQSGVDPKAFEATKTKAQLDLADGRFDKVFYDEMLQKYPNVFNSPADYEGAVKSLLKAKTDKIRTAGPGFATTAPTGLDDINYSLLITEDDNFHSNFYELLGAD